MREILFRGKRLDNGEWIYGYYAKLPHPITAFLKDYIVEVKFDESDVAGNIEYNLVDPETVGQFTGVFDKNGNKIFESDIIRVMLPNNKPKRDFIARALWDSAFSGFRLSKYDYFMNANRYGFEIIGNIHDNKELLK